VLLSLGCLGFGGLITAFPPKQIFSDIRFIGACHIDNFHVQNIELSDADIESITDEQVYGMNTIMLANFEDSAEAGNLINDDLPITHWRIYRKKEGESLFTLIGEVPISSIESKYLDVLAVNQVPYDYEVKAVSSGIEGDGIEGDGMVDFYGWILSDIESDILYRFDIEIESSDIRVLRDMHRYDNYSEKPAFSFGKKKYKEGSLTTMPLSYDSLECTLETLNELEAFINNGEVKMLKNTKGELFYVVTYDFRYKYTDETSEQIYTITFSFAEAKP
jgi:hypothetical protein